MLNYKGFIGEYVYDKDARLFSGQAIVIRDVIHFQAANREDVEKEFRLSVDDYLSFCAELDRKPK